MSGQLRNFGRYQILGEVGQGAMGVVHKALDPGLDRVVALKTMVGSEVLDPESKERFLREARSAARLQHPNIITIFELGEVEGMPFIAMELLEGENLADAVAAGKLTTLSDRLKVVEQICQGLDYAHERGVVHRDVKPSNVFLLPDGTAKLLDFGIARLEGGTFATRAGMVLGTPSYMAPEQFSEVDVDHRVDMWAVGVILYELISGVRPFDGETVVSLIYKIVHTDLPQLHAGSVGAPQSVVEIVHRALAKEPAHRFDTMAMMGSAIRFAIGEQVSRPAPPVSRAAPAFARNIAPPGTPSPISGYPASAVSGKEQAAAARPTDAVDTKPLPEASDAASSPAAVEGPMDTASFRDLGTFGERSDLHVVAISPNEKVLAVGGLDGSIRMWSLDTQMKLATLRSRLHLRTGHAAMTTGLAFSAAGELLATGHLDGSIYLWETRTGLEFEARLRHEGAVHGLAFSPDNQLLISSGMDSTIKYWELPEVLQGEARRQMRRQPAGCTAQALSLSGKTVITGHDNRSIRVHDTESGRLLATVHGHKSVPCALALAGGEDLLLSGSRNGTIRLFRFESKAQLRSFDGHQKAISSLCFFPDGRHFASVSMEHGVMIWNVAKPEPVNTLWGNPDESMVSLFVVPGRRRLLCGLADGRIRWWEYSA